MPGNDNIKNNTDGDVFIDFSISFVKQINFGGWFRYFRYKFRRGLKFNFLKFRSKIMAYIQDIPGYPHKNIIRSNKNYKMQ